MGRKCRVKDCLSDSRRSEDMGVTFHKIPFHADIRPKWLSLCKIPSENQANKIIYVCSRHFRRNDFCTFKGTKYMLKQGVLPSMFSWTNEPNKVQKVDTAQTKNDESTSSKVEQSTECETSDVQSENIEKTNDEITPRESYGRSRRSKKKSIDTVENTTADTIEIVHKEEEKPTVEEIEDIKLEDKDLTLQDEYIPVTDFTQGSRVEVTDFSGAWFPARIIEVDYTENEVFIEFEDSTKSNEWIPMDSKRLRQLMDIERAIQYDVGERVMAMWKNSIKFPATIQKSLGNDTYEVLFDDNIPLVLKSSKISKSNQALKKMTPITPKLHPSPLFAPVEGSKQDRRDRKRKINVAELFTRKRPKTDTPNEKSGGTSGSDGEKDIDKETKPQGTPKTTELNTPITPVNTEGGIFSPNSGDWICRWMNGEPIGVPSVVDTRRSVIVNDPRLPAGWIKHLVCRAQGTSAGKWDTVIICPEGKKFRSKNDIQVYLEKEKLPHPIDQFDFSLHLKKARSLGLYEINENIKKQTPKTLLIPAAKGKVTPKTTDVKGEQTEKDISLDDSINNSSLKIICENGAYKCPIEGCAKTFRKENLTQMHVKHYHPEFSKFIGSTPNVADLAYARTVGEPIEDFLPKSRFSQGTISSPTAEKKVEIIKPTVRTTVPNKTVVISTPTEIETPPDVENIEIEPPTVPTPPVIKQKAKESEIVKILTSDTKTTKPQDVFKMDTKLVKIPTFSSPKYDKKDSPQHVSELKDILEKRDIPKHETKHSFEPKPSGGGGIKTLLPVIRTSQDTDKKHIEPPSLFDTEELPKPPVLAKGVFGKQLKRRRNNSEADTSFHRRRRYPKHDYEYYADYHDTGSRSPDYTPYTRKKKTVEFNDLPHPPDYNNYQPQAQHPKQIVTDTGEVIKIVTMKQEEIINCTCGFMEEDGLMIQCELCLCWQHAYCNSIEREDQVPEKYICYICQNPLRMRASRKYIHDQDWLKQGTLATTSFHATDEGVLKTRFERLRKSHELTGNIRELSSVMHSLRVKLKIAENKDHPKFYLWSKPWPKIEIDNNIEELLENHNRTEMFVPPEAVKEEIVPSNDIESSLNKLLNSNESVDPHKQLDFESDIVPNIKPETTSSSTTNNELLNILEGNEGSDSKISEESIDNNKDTSTSNIELSSKKDDGNELKTNKNWIEGGLMSGEVSDGEMISQALASEALANDLLSSPTTLNLSALTPSDIEKIQNTIDNSAALVSPCIPEPEAKIESDACRENLIDNISHYQKLINNRMDCIEEQIKKLEDENGDTYNSSEIVDQNDIRMKETFMMLIRDLGKVRKFAALY